MLTFQEAAIAPANKFQFARSAVAEVNVGYLQKSDLPLLLDTRRMGSVAVLNDLTGVLYFVPDLGSSLLAYQEKRWGQDGFSLNFIALMHELAVQHIMYVRFEVDGGYIAGLKLVQKQQYEDLAQFFPSGRTTVAQDIEDAFAESEEPLPDLVQAS